MVYLTYSDNQSNSSATQSAANVQKSK